jgi:hypothetical protein
MSVPATLHPTNLTPAGPSQSHDRPAVAHILHDYDLAARQGTSQRDFARQRGLPHATLQRWLHRRDRLRPSSSISPAGWATPALASSQCAFSRR